MKLYLLLFILFYFVNQSCQLPLFPEEEIAVNNIISIFSITDFNSSTICTEMYVVCKTIGNYSTINTFGLPSNTVSSSTGVYPPDILAFKNLFRLDMKSTPTLMDGAFIRQLPSLPLIQVLGVTGVVPSDGYLLGSYFNQTKIYYLDMTNCDWVIQPDLLTNTSLVTLLVYNGGPNYGYPATIEGTSRVSSIQVVMNSPAGYFDATNYTSLIFVSIMINSTQSFTYNQFDTFKVMNTLSFYIYNNAGAIKSPFPTTLLNSKTLKKLYFSGSAWSNSVLDFSQSIITEMSISMSTGSSSLGDIILSPGIITNSSISVRKLTMSGLIKQTVQDLSQFTYFDHSNSNGMSLMSVDYSKITNLRLYSTPIIGGLNDNMCFMNWSVLTGGVGTMQIQAPLSYVPRCFHCESVTFKSIFSTTYNPCVTNIISTNKSFIFHTDDNSFQVQGSDLGWDLKAHPAAFIVNATNVNTMFMIPNTQPTNYDNGTIPLVFHYREASGGLLESIQYSYYQPTYNGQSLNESMLVVSGTEFGNQPKLIQIMVANQLINQSTIVGANHTSISVSPSPLPYQSDLLYSTSIIIGQRRVDTIVDTLGGVPILIAPFPWMSDKGGNVTFFGNHLTFDKTLLNMSIKLENGVVVPMTIWNSSNTFINVGYPPLPLTGYQTLLTNIHVYQQLNDVLYIVNSSLPSTSSSESPPVQPCYAVPNGYCQDNQLICVPPFFGYNCTSLPVPITNNTNSPLDPTNNSTDSSGHFNTMVSIIQVNELELDGKTIVRSFPLKVWKFTNVTSSDDNNGIDGQYQGSQFQHIYQSNLTDTNNITIDTVLTVNVTLFNKDENITFASTLVDMRSGSVKYTIELTSYPFQQSTNTLQIVMSALMTVPNGQSSCSSISSSSSSSSSTDNIGNFDYLSFRINNFVFYGRFIRRAVLDKRFITVTTQFYQDTLYNRSSYNATSNISINLPFYMKSAILDPDFSVLIDQNGDTSSNKICTNLSNGLSTSQLAGIVVGAVGFASVIGIGTAYHFYKKNQTLKNNRELKKKLEKK